MDPAQAKEIASIWLSAFASGVESADVDAVVSTIRSDGWLRDLLMFTWDIRNLHGTAEIKEYLSDTLAKAQIRDIVLDESAHLAPTTVPLFGGLEISVEAAFVFQSVYGPGKGYVRLLDDGDGNWKAFTAGTILCDLRGHEESTGPEPSVNPQRPWLAWQELEAEKREKIESNPQVVIIGAGQTGLMLAARFRRMNIPALVIEKNDRVGDHWRRRYPTLALHTNRYQHTFLYQPFPDSWPVYTPRDKLADWMEHYVRSQELIVWTNSEVLPQPSYDPKTKRWHVEINRNGARVVLNPAHIVVAIVALCQEAAMLTMKQDIHAPFVPHSAFFDATRAVRKQITSDVLQKFTEWGMESGVTQA